MTLPTSGLVAMLSATAAAVTGTVLAVSPPGEEPLTFRQECVQVGKLPWLDCVYVECVLRELDRHEGAPEDCGLLLDGDESERSKHEAPRERGRRR